MRDARELLQSLLRVHGLGSPVILVINPFYFDLLRWHSEGDKALQNSGLLYRALLFLK